MVIAMCNAYDIGKKIRPGHRALWEKSTRDRLADLPKSKSTLPESFRRAKTSAFGRTWIP